MERKDRSLLDIISQELKKGYWKSVDAARYAPMLFAMVKPEDNVRDALTAIYCSEEKEKKLKAMKSFINTEQEGHTFLQDFEKIISQKKDRLLMGNESNTSERNYRDIIMMILASNFASQKNSLTISTDVTQLYHGIYGECKTCTIKGSCKGAQGILTEYIVSALEQLNVDLNEVK